MSNPWISISKSQNIKIDENTLIEIEKLEIPPKPLPPQAPEQYECCGSGSKLIILYKVVIHVFLIRII